MSEYCINKLSESELFTVTHLNENHDDAKIYKEINKIQDFEDIQNDLYEPRQANLCLRAFRHDKF